MRIENVAVDSSPLICLSKSGQIDLLNQLFKKIIIPDAVYKEVVYGNTQDPFSNSIISKRVTKFCNKK
jgi:predicted nucleic acid-binding protein